MYISSVGNNNLQLTGLYAGKDMVLDSAKDILMSPDASAQAYLNAGRLLDLKAEGGIGAKDSGVRILGNGATINAEAKDGNIYLAGKSKAGEQDGLLLLGMVKTNPDHTIDVAAETSLGLGSNENASPLVSQVQTDTVNLSSDREINLKNGTLTAGTLKLKAGGSINQTAAHAITASDVSVDAAAGISLNSGAEAESKMFNAFKEVTLNNASEATDIVLGNGGDEDLKVIFADGSKAKDVTVRNYANGEANDLDIHGPIAAEAGIALINDEGSLVTTGGLDAKADIRETAKGSLNNSDALHAEQDIVLTATDGSIINDAAITAKRNVTMKAGDSIENRAATTAYTGAISLNAYHDIKQKSDAKAGTDITAESADGSVTVEGSLTSGKATLAKATGGDVSVTGNVTGGTSVTAQATEGNVTVDGSLTSKDGNTVLSASDSQKLEGKGNIRVTGSVDSAHDIEMTTDNGDIEIGGTLTAAQNLQAVAQKTGHILFTGDAEATAGKLQAETHAGNIKFAGKASSGTDLTATTQNKGNIVFDGLVNAGQNLVADAVKEGTITLRKDVTAVRNATMHTNNGSILFQGADNATTEDIHLTAQNGDLFLHVRRTGDIKDSHRSVNGDRGFVTAANGNLTIRHDGTGDGDLYSLSSKGTTRVDLKDGSLYLDNIDGNLIALFVRNPEKTTDIKHMSVGRQLSLAGDNLSFEDITQREGADGKVTITTSGAHEDTPIRQLHIGDIRTNLGSSAEFKHLWLEKGDVTVSQGSLDIDKLYVLDKATFSNGVMMTNVFGSAPVYDDTITSAYWNNTAVNNPKASLAAWMSDTLSLQWAYLHFPGQGYVQFSNGHLLDVQPHNYVYSQRYSENDVMCMSMDADFYDFYRQYYHPGLFYHERYNLVDVSQWQDDAAQEGEITVE